MDITGLGSAFDFAGNLMNRFFPPKMSEDEKLKLQAGLADVVEQRDAVRDEIKAEVMKAELSQGDAYTKRARPTVVYMGLVFILLVHVLFPITSFFFGREMPEISLPTEFWYTWGGVCSVWIIGRTVERTGPANNIIKAITGSKK